MVATPLSPRQLSAREDPGASEHGNWGTLQIVTPIIVGGVLILLFALFALYTLWRRRPNNKPSYSYQQIRAGWTSKIENMLPLRRQRQRVRHSSARMTLDDSMHSAGLALDFNPLPRQYRSGSSDSQTPLTSACYAFDYPPNKPPESPPPPPKRRSVRWWWFLGSRPQQIKSAEPSQRWHVDGPDGSSTGHGHSAHGHTVSAAMAPLEEEPEGMDEVIHIGENFASVASTPMTQHFPEQANLVRGLSGNSSSSNARMPVPIVSYSPSHPGTPVSSASRDLPPSYTRYPSPAPEDISRQTQHGPYMTVAAPARAAGYSSPRPSHGRELSSDSFLATQTPMAVASMY